MKDKKGKRPAGLPLAGIFNLASNLVRGIDLDSAAEDLERLTRRKGGDPLTVWREVRDLAERRIQALTPAAEPERGDVIDVEVSG